MLRPGRESARKRMLRVGVFALALALPAYAAGPVLHEYFEPNPDEDLRLHATAFGGKLPAALSAGNDRAVLAPNADRNTALAKTTYSSNSTPYSNDASYRIDRDTTKPDLVGYDDPFTPPIAPFKRQFAYDSVDDAFDLVVHDSTLRKIPVGVPVAAGDDQFYADLIVDVAPNTYVRIPSVGPGTKVLAAPVTQPPIDLQLYHDGADNWFALAGVKQRVRMVLQLAVDRGVFGSKFAPTADWYDLRPMLVALPPAMQHEADAVARRIGVTHAERPARAVERLVEYFRGFAPSQDLPNASGGVALYRELAESKKGVCRHRAYAFTITALGVGIPARMIRNEAHAWVEVYDSAIWHRIDLGGAANRMQIDADPSAPAHAPPPDPYAWPDGSDSGLSAADRALTGGGRSGAQRSSSTSPSGSAAAGADPSASAADAGAADDSRPASVITLDVSHEEVLRGSPVDISGMVRADGRPCSSNRVDVALFGADARLHPIGSLPTAEDGRFSGKLTVPATVPVGDYRIVATTPGGGACGKSR